MDSSLISNTSHVILYRTASTAFSTIVTNSNTSYVILYLILSEGMCTLLIFKYILCYSLSLFAPPLHLPLHIQIHLMLFFIAPLIWHRHSLSYSNTSYVILYLSCPELWMKRTAIQIHLMLFFIIIYIANFPSWNFIQIHLMLFFIPRISTFSYINPLC